MSDMEQPKQFPGPVEGKESLKYSRREAMSALVKYSGTVACSAGVMVTAEGLVSSASAYNCPRASTNPACQ